MERAGPSDAQPLRDRDSLAQPACQDVTDCPQLSHRQLVPGLWHQVIAGGCGIAQAKAYREGATCKWKDLAAF